MSKLSEEEARDKVFNDYLDNITKTVRKARLFYKTTVAELEGEIVQLKKDAAPFQNQIDQRKTYKAFDEQSQTE